ENDIGLEFQQACRIENSFLKILVVVREVENRLYALLQQQQLKKSGNLIDRGPAQECDANGQEVRAILQLTTEPLLLPQKNDRAGICDHCLILCSLPCSGQKLGFRGDAYRD